MGVLDFLRKIGVLQYGAKTAKGRGAEGYMLDDAWKYEKGGSQKKVGPASGGQRTTNPVGRQVFFWIALIVGVLSTLIVWAGADIGWMLATLIVWAAYMYYAKRFAFDGAYYPGSAAGLFTMALVASFVFLAFGTGGVTTSGGIGTSVGLDYEDARLALMQPDGTLNLLEGDVVPHGEKLALVFLKVGKFKEGSDGRHWFDLDMDLSDAEGERIYAQEGILSASGQGRERLGGGVAQSPFTFINTAMLEPGQYRFKVTIRDRIGTGHASVTRRFEVR
jgi:hypothetical protein